MNPSGLVSVRPLNSYINKFYLVSVSLSHLEKFFQRFVLEIMRVTNANSKKYSTAIFHVKFAVNTSLTVMGIHCEV